MASIASQNEAANRMQLLWSEESYRVNEVISSFYFPLVAAYDARAYYVSRERSNIDFSQPFLFYAPREVLKVTAVSLLWEDRAGEYKPLGDPLIVPSDYAGWFEVVSGGCHEEEDGHLPHFRDVGSIAVSECSKFLIGGTESVEALLIKGNPEDTGKHLHHRLLPGDILKVGRVYEGKATKQKWIDRMWKKTTRKESFLMCRDEKEREVLVPVNATGRFYSICERGSPDAKGVRQISSILKTCKLPCIVRLAFGEVPSTRCLFTGTLQLESMYLQSSVLASTMFYKRNIFVEIPTDIPLKFRMAENTQELVRTEAFRDALRMCEERMDVYKKKIKVSCLIDNGDNVVDPLPTRGEDDVCPGSWGGGVPHVPPKTPGMPGARESFFQSLENTGGSPCPTPPDRRKKRSSGVSLTASPATPEQSIARVKSECDVVDNDYEEVWRGPRNRSESAAAVLDLARPSTSGLELSRRPSAGLDLARLPSAGSRLPKVPSCTELCSDRGQSTPTPTLGVRTSPDGGEVAPVLTGRAGFDTPPPGKLSAETPDILASAPLGSDGHPEAGSDGGPGAGSGTTKTSPTSSSAEPFVNISVSISSCIPAKDGSLRSVATSRAAMTSLEALSVVPPPPPAQARHAGKSVGYVNDTAASSLTSVGVDVSVSAGNFGKERLRGQQVDLDSCPPPPIPARGSASKRPPNQELGKSLTRSQEVTRDVTGLHPGQPFSGPTRHSVKVMVRDSCVYLPMELVEDGKADTSTPPWPPASSQGEIPTPTECEDDVYVFADGLQRPRTLQLPSTQTSEYSEGESLYQNIFDLKPLPLGDDNSPSGKPKDGITKTRSASPSRRQQESSVPDARRRERIGSGSETDPPRKNSITKPYENVAVPHTPLSRAKSYAEGMYLADMPPLPPKTPGLPSTRMTFDLDRTGERTQRVRVPDPPAKEGPPPLPMKTHSFNRGMCQKPLLRSRTVDNDDDKDYDIPCPFSGLKARDPTADSSLRGKALHSGIQGPQDPSSLPPSTCDKGDYDFPHNAKDTAITPAKAVPSSDDGDYDIPCPSPAAVLKQAAPRKEKPATPPRVRKARSLGDIQRSLQMSSSLKSEGDNGVEGESTQSDRNTLPKIHSGDSLEILQSVPEVSPVEDSESTEKLPNDPQPNSEDTASRVATSLARSQEDAKEKTEPKLPEAKEEAEAETSSDTKLEMKSVTEGVEKSACVGKVPHVEKSSSPEREQPSATKTAAVPSKPVLPRKPAIGSKPQLSPKPGAKRISGMAKDRPQTGVGKTKVVGKASIKEQKKASLDENEPPADKPSPPQDASDSSSAPKLSFTGKPKLEHVSSTQTDSQQPNQNPFLPKGGLKPVHDRSRNCSFGSTKGSESPTNATKFGAGGGGGEKAAPQSVGGQNIQASKFRLPKHTGSILCGRGTRPRTEDRPGGLGDSKGSKEGEATRKSTASTDAAEEGKLSKETLAGEQSGRASKRSEDSDDDTAETLTRMTVPQLQRALATIGLRQETLSVLEVEKVDGQRLLSMDAAGLRDEFPMLRNIDIKKIQMFVHGWRPKERD